MSATEPIVNSPQSDNTQEPQVNQTTQYDLSNTDGIVQMFRDKLKDESISKQVVDYFKLLSTKYQVGSYNIIFLYDEHTSLGTYEANKIYEAVSKPPDRKSIFLVLNSHGGKVESAYLISKTCKKLSKDKFVIAMPRSAKSAATLLALGADEIHMGLMSELGPIDPQIGGYPALGLGNSLNVLAKLACEFPGSADMFANYLAKKLDLKDLGFFERVSESAAQYAERLLFNKQLPNDQTPNTLAQRFVYHYKDHGFVIDIDEATTLLGSGIVRQNTPEYSFSNEVYSCLSFLDFLYGYLRGKDFSYVGSLDNGFTVRDRES